MYIAAYRLSEVPQLAAPVRLTGTPMLSFLLMVVNATISLGILRWLDLRFPYLTEVRATADVWRRWSMCVAVTVVTWAVAGLAVTAGVRGDQGPVVHVAYVQPGLDDITPGVLVGGQSDDGRTPDARRDVQARHLTELTGAAASEGAELVVWPEEVLDYDPHEIRTDWIPDKVRGTGVCIVTGFTRDFADPSRRIGRCCSAPTVRSSASTARPSG